MTNADHINHIGKKSKKDLTITYLKFSKLTLLQWKEIGGLLFSKINPMSDEGKLSLSELRQKRLQYYEK